MNVKSLSDELNFSLLKYAIPDESVPSNSSLIDGIHFCCNMQAES